MSVEWQSVLVDIWSLKCTCTQKIFLFVPAGDVDAVITLLYTGEICRPCQPYMLGKQSVG